MSRTFGFDLSAWQFRYDPAEVDFDRLMDWDLKPAFVLLRAFFGLRLDPGFHVFRREAERVGLPWGSYYFLLRTEGVQSRSQDAAIQANRWLTVPGGPLGRFVDYEAYKGTVPTGTALLAAWDTLEATDGRPAGCYSRYRLVDRYMNAIPADRLNARPWWLAQYLFSQRLRGEHPGPPTLPKRVERESVIIHQTADKLAGPPGGVASKALDRNRWAGPVPFEDYAWTPDPALSLADRVLALETEGRKRGWTLD